MLVKSFNGSYIKIRVTAEDVYDFNSTWPCSNVPVTDIDFEFQMSNRDLVGIESMEGDSSDFNGDALKALSDDAQKFAFPELQRR